MEDKVPLLTQDDVEADADRARGLLAVRLQMLWEAALPHIDGSREAEGLRVDPRMVKLGMDSWDRMYRLYRMDAARPSVDQEQSAEIVCDADRRAVVASLLELEARTSTTP